MNSRGFVINLFNLYSNFMIKLDSSLGINPRVGNGGT